MRNDFNSNYLAHHGILGMKWGKKNGPPYPLGASDHSQSEKKAGYRKSLGGGRNEELYDRKDKKREDTKSAKSKETANKSTSAGLSDAQKRALKIGLGIAAGSAITAGAAFAVKHVDKKITAALINESKQIGKAYTDEFLKLKGKSDLAFTLSETIKTKPFTSKRNIDAISAKNIGQHLSDYADLSRKDAMEEVSKRMKGFTKKEKIDYVKRILKGNSRAFTTAELHKMGIDTSFNSTKYDEALLDELIKAYMLKIPKS